MLRRPIARLLCPTPQTRKRAEAFGTPLCAWVVVSTVALLLVPAWLTGAVGTVVLLVDALVCVYVLVMLAQSAYARLGARRLGVPRPRERR